MLQAADYELIRESVGLADRSPRGKLRVLGTEAAEFLQGQVTNDVEGLAEGSGCYAALLDHKGKVRVDMRILRGGDWIWLNLLKVKGYTNPGQASPEPVAVIPHQLTSLPVIPRPTMVEGVTYGKLKPGWKNIYNNKS